MSFDHIFILTMAVMEKVGTLIAFLAFLAWFRNPPS